MITILSALVSLLSFRVRSRASLELELVALRHQVTVLRRQRPGRARLFCADRLLWVWLYQVWPQIINAMVVCTEYSIQHGRRAQTGEVRDLMKDLFKLILGVVASLFKSRATLEAEFLVLRQQINVLRRRTPKRPHLNNTDRFLFVWLYRWFPSVLGAIAIIRPETIIHWHRAGFRAYWRWRSRNRIGRPKVSAELRTLIGEMSGANPLWGAPRIHGELLKLGFEAV